MLRERATASGAVPPATWWSSREVQVANEQWCREAPLYSARKPPLLQTALPSGWKTKPPTLTRELVSKHASPKNFIIATYINFKRLDFAYTMVRHLVALNQPHYLVGAMDLPALEGLLSHGVPAFYIDSGLTTEDYGWGTPEFRKMGLHKVQPPPSPPPTSPPPSPPSPPPPVATTALSITTLATATARCSSCSIWRSSASTR